MKMKKLMFAIAIVPFVALADNARDNFLKQQAYAEMQRVTGEVDEIQRNMQDLERKVDETSRMKTEIAQLKQEVESLRAQLAEIKRQQSADRDAIINDLTAKILKMQRTVATTPASSGATRRPAPAPVVYNGPVGELEVVSGDTLSTIARACGTTVATIKAINGLKSDSLRVGQKLKVPTSK